MTLGPALLRGASPGRCWWVPPVSDSGVCGVTLVGDVGWVGAKVKGEARAVLVSATGE
jgi:hypothetical protein